MGIYDRDWHKAERFNQRQADRLKEQRLAKAFGLKTGGVSHLRIPLMADSDSIPIADSVPDDGGHAARVS